MKNNVEETAFPVTDDQRSPDRSGMSLRDWFAGMALSGVWAGRESDYFGITQPTTKDVAEASYRLADAMMEARKKFG